MKSDKSPKANSARLESRLGVAASEALIQFAMQKVTVRKTQARIDAALLREALEPELIETLFAVLNVENEGLARPAEVARKLAVSPGTLTARYRRMEDLGWITRHAADGDRRSLAIRVTEDGLQAAREAWRITVDTFEGGEPVD